MPLTYEQVLKNLEDIQVLNGWEIESNFRPCYAFPRRSGEKRAIPEYFDDNEYQVNLWGVKI